MIFYVINRTLFAKLLGKPVIKFEQIDVLPKSTLTSSTVVDTVSSLIRLDFWSMVLYLQSNSDLLGRCGDISVRIGRVKLGHR